MLKPYSGLDFAKGVSAAVSLLFFSVYFSRFFPGFFPFSSLCSDSFVFFPFFFRYRFFCFFPVLSVFAVFSGSDYFLFSPSVVVRFFPFLRFLPFFLLSSLFFSVSFSGKNGEIPFARPLLRNPDRGTFKLRSGNVGIVYAGMPADYRVLLKKGRTSTTPNTRGISLPPSESSVPIKLRREESEVSQRRGWRTEGQERPEYGWRT